MDIQIIKFFKDNMNMLSIKHETAVYENLKAQYSITKSAQFLRERFLNVILPNVYKYKVLDVSETIEFYNKAGLTIPDDFINIFNENDAVTLKSNKMPKVPKILPTRIESNIADHNTVQHNKETTDVATQLNFEGQTKIEFIMGYIQVTLDAVKHVYIPYKAADITPIKDKLISEHGIIQNNIHIINEENYSLLIKYKDVNEAIEKKSLYLKNNLHDDDYVLKCQKVLEQFEMPGLDYNKLENIYKPKVYCALCQKNIDENKETKKRKTFPKD